jgi:hypothetical protein
VHKDSERFCLYTNHTCYTTLVCLSYRRLCQQHCPNDTGTSSLFLLLARKALMHVRDNCAFDWANSWGSEAADFFEAKGSSTST